MNRPLVALLLAAAVSACSTNKASQTAIPQASVSVGQSANATATATTPSHVWVCHGGKNPKWQRVSASAADAHHRHGDPVSNTAKEKNQRCTR